MCIAKTSPHNVVQWGNGDGDDDGRRERRELHIAPSSATEENIHTATPSAARYDIRDTQTKEYNTEKTYEIIARWLMDYIIMSLWCLWCVKCIYCSHHTSQMHLVLLLLLLLLKMRRRYCWDLFGNYMFSHMVWSIHILASVVSSCRHRRRSRRCHSRCRKCIRVKCTIGHALQVWSIRVVCAVRVYSQFPFGFALREIQIEFSHHTAPSIRDSLRQMGDACDCIFGGWRTNLCPHSSYERA